MKNILKIFAVVLVAAFLTVSCKEKGGTIEVKNEMSSEIWVIIKKGSTNPSISQGDGDLIQPNKTKSWDFDEDGVYVVAAISLTGAPKYKAATLLAGNTEKITFK